MTTSTSTPATAPEVRSRLGRAARFLLFGSWLATACATSRGTIGAVLAQGGDRRLSIREVPPGLAAARAGVQSGDELLLIEGRDVRRMSASEVHWALEGDVGQPVKLTLIRDGQQVVRVTLYRSAALRRSGALDRSDAASR